MHGDDNFYGQLVSKIHEDNSCVMKKLEFEQSIIDKLIGHSIRAVDYFEIDYGTIVPTWSGLGEFDSLDFGLNLILEDGSVVAITWGSEFTPYGLSFTDEPLSAEDSNWRSGDGASRWHSILGSPIVEVSVYWCGVEYEGVRTEYPQDLELRFENGTMVVISAFEYRSDGFMMGMMDHITVVFKESDMKHFRLARYEDM